MAFQLSRLARTAHSGLGTQLSQCVLPLAATQLLAWNLPTARQPLQLTNLRTSSAVLFPFTISTRLLSTAAMPAPDTTLYLRNLATGAEIFLVGTAHVSRKSALEVREMIHLVKPDAIMVELDPTRAEKLRSQEEAEKGSFIKDFMAHMGLPGAAFGESFLKAGMAGFYQVLRTMGLEPGLEFKVAIEEAERTGVRLVYGDQDARVTIKRLSQALGGPNGLGFMGILRLMMSSASQPIPPDLYQLLKGGLSTNLEARVEALKNRQMARSMTQYMRDTQPELAKALIDERDEIMVRCLRELKGRVVAVVGLAHLDGIERRWQDGQQPAKVS